MSATDVQSNNSSPVLDPVTRMRQLVEMSHNITVDLSIPVSKYFNSGRELIKSANALKEKGDIEKAFVLYLRYTSLFLEKLIHHPGYSKADKAEKALVKNECNTVLELAENLKKEIKEKYAKEYEQYQQTMKSNTKEEIQKRSINPTGSPAPDCDIDEIDRKFNFSEQPEEKKQEGPFDPFNIEELKQSFDSKKD